jgi:hypothetical protein
MINPGKGKVVEITKPSLILPFAIQFFHLKVDGGAGSVFPCLGRVDIKEDGSLFDFKNIDIFGI